MARYSAAEGTFRASKRTFSKLKIACWAVLNCSSFLIMITSVNVEFREHILLNQCAQISLSDFENLLKIYQISSWISILPWIGNYHPLKLGMFPKNDGSRGNSPPLLRPIMLNTGSNVGEKVQLEEYSRVYPLTFYYENNQIYLEKYCEISIFNILGFSENIAAPRKYCAGWRDREPISQITTPPSPTTSSPTS